MARYSSCCCTGSPSQHKHPTAEIVEEKTHLLRPCIPNLISPRVEGAVEQERKYIEEDVHASDPDENTVATLVQRRIILAVNVGVDDGAVEGKTSEIGEEMRSK